MEIIYKRLDELHPYENNPRRNGQSVKYVANSIKRFGFKTPIVIDANNVIIAGHTRYLAAQELGLEEVPCVIADGLTEDEAKAFRLADNKTAEYALWDFDLLDEELTSLADFDMEEYGFTTAADLDEGLAIKEEAQETNISATFTITVNFPIDEKELVNDYIQKNGKAKLADELLRAVKEDRYA